MKSNYKFGNDDRNWVTSTQAFYQPIVNYIKSNILKRYLQEINKIMIH